MLCRSGSCLVRLPGVAAAATVLGFSSASKKLSAFSNRPVKIRPCFEGFGR